MREEPPPASTSRSERSAPSRGPIDPLPDAVAAPPLSFAVRFTTERMTALEAVVGFAPALEEESALVECLQPDAHTTLLRGVFDRSRALGLAMVAAQGRPFQLDALRDVLEAAETPCFAGVWQKSDRDGAFVLERNGCAVGPHPQVCDYWREALDGLVMGLGDDARFSRHHCLARCGLFCRDVLYSERQPSQRYAQIPAALQQQLFARLHSLVDSGMRLTLLGLSEDVLFYRLENATGPACGPGGGLLRSLVAQAVSALAPGFTAQESSPVGVFRD